MARLHTQTNFRSGDASAAVAGGRVSPGNVGAVSGEAQASLIGANSVEGSAAAQSRAAEIALAGKRRIVGTLSAQPTPALLALTGLRRHVGTLAAQAQPALFAASAESSVFYELPTQLQEQALYDNILGWAWTQSDKNTTFPSTPGVPTNIDWHNDTEADDLWNHYQMYRRTGTALYRNWAQAWRDRFVNNYLTQVQSPSSVEAQQAYPDHVYGWGLVLWHHFENDPAALTVAQNILMNHLPSVSPGSTEMAQFESRGRARWLILACYVAQKTANLTHITRRNQYIDAWLQSPDYQAGVIGGNYFASRLQAGYTGSSVGGTAAYDAGRRFNSSFSMGLHVEALWRAYLATGRDDVRARLEDIAWWTHYYSLVPTWVNPMVSARYGQEGNLTRWQRETDSGNANLSSAAAEYSTAAVNTLVIGYKLTGRRSMLTQARQLWRQGTRWAPAAYGASALVPTNQVEHYADTRTEDGVYFNWNKGELQYNYLLFENGGEPTRIKSTRTCAIKTLADSLSVGQYAQLTGVGNISALVDTVSGGVGHIFPYADKIPYDPRTRRAYLAGSDDPGNGRRLVYYDVDTNAWVTLTSGGGGVAHIYGAQTIDILNRRYWYNNAGTVSGGVSYRNLDTGAVTSGQQTGITVGGADDAPAMEFFPDRFANYYVRGNTIYERRETATSWSVLSTSISVTFHCVAHYNAWHRCLVFGGGNYSANNLYRLNLDGTITTLGNGAGFGIDCVRTEWVEDPATGDFLVYYHNNGSTGFRRFNPGTNTWSNPGTSGIPAAIFTINSYSNQLLMVATTIPEHGVNLYLAAISGQTPTMYVRKYA